ncbi:porin [Methylocapsa palsarum]|uniref:Porin n=1 Tax=Methylocapsa palsarum TaxID=1612308 RepID=A0A1I3WQ69_9HYPH|nr:porin [Methylocapsa palsarum]SFK09814.1 Porin subfamily protein [Methylocapsa palsarum]
MKMYRGLLLGSAAALTGIAGAQAADLPATKAAPIEYVRICDAYGAGFFYIPGTETCLKIGGQVVTEVRSYDSSYSMSSNISGQGKTAIGATNPFALPAGGAFRATGGASSVGYVPTPGDYTNSRSRDTYGWNSLGRVELDARNGTPFGTLRAFLRVDAYVGSGYAQTGALSTGGSYNSNGNPYNTTAGPTATRETTIVSKAFIQFAGLTAGRAQSMFDFYANAYNYANIGGSNATTQLLAYTATFGSGFSTTFSVEDQNARQAFIGSTIAGGTRYPFAGSVAYTPPGALFGAGTTYTGTPAGNAWPDIVANLRYDDKWGAVQVSAAGHEARASLFSSTSLQANGTAATTYAFPTMTSNAYGWAVQGGLQLNLDYFQLPYLSPGDKLWIQAAYEQGALSYVWGNNLAGSYGASDGSRYYGAGFTPADTSAGWNTNMYDCIFTASGSCEQQKGWNVVAAFKHYWIPTVSSAVYGSYTEVNYSQNALAGFGGAVGVSNLKTARIGTNLVWTPIKGFDIGGEFMYVNVTQSRPVGLAPDKALNLQGLPSWRGTNNEYEGRVRVQRAF